MCSVKLFGFLIGKLPVQSRGRRPQEPPLVPAVTAVSGG
jgi:hypothetical protein